MVQLNSVDKAINFFSPSWGASRLEKRARLEAFLDLNELKGGYSGAGYGKNSTKDWVVLPTSPNSETSQQDDETLYSRSYNSYKNDMIARSIVTRYRTNAIGDGLKPIPQVDGDALGLSDIQVEELEKAIKRRS